MNKAVVLSCHNTGLALIRGFGHAGIPVSAVYYDSKDMVYVSRYVSESYNVPDPEIDAEGFIDFLLKKFLLHQESSGKRYRNNDPKAT